MPIAVIALASSFVFLFGHGYYLGKWMAVAAAGSLFIADKIKVRFGWSSAIFFVYLIGSTIWAAIYENRFSTIDAYNKMGLKYYAVESAWKLCLFITPLLLVRTAKWRIAENGRALCICFFAMSALQVLWEWSKSGCSGVNACGGALMNPSLNGAAMATVLPLIPLWPLAVAIAALCSFLGKTSIGAGMISVFLLLKAIEKRLWWLISLIPVTLILGVITHGNKEFFDSSRRFQMWAFFIEKWASNWKNIPFGTGFGTFGVFSLALQKGFNQDATDWWIWMHNDWLQMVFECGLIGGALLFWVYADCLRGLWKEKRTPELQSLLLFGVMMGCEYGLHIGPICAFAAWLFYMGRGQSCQLTTQE